MSNSKFILDLKDNKSIEILFRALTDKNVRAGLATRDDLPKGVSDIIKMADDSTFIKACIDVAQSYYDYQKDKAKADQFRITAVRLEKYISNTYPDGAKLLQDFAKTVPRTVTDTLKTNTNALVNYEAVTNVVVFTGGECFLLGDRLDRLVRHATERGFSTRCVTNGYWATSKSVAESRVSDLVKAGLKEINFSTGPMHSRHIPIKRVINGAAASLKAGLTTVINIETFNESDFDPTLITNSSGLLEANVNKNLLIQKSAWIMKKGKRSLTYPPEYSRFRRENMKGCTSCISSLAVTSGLDLIACCGFSYEAIPELRTGSVADQSISQVVAGAPDDLLKIWIHIEGPEKILEFVKEHKPDYELPLHAVHPCETCLHLYKDEVAKRVLREHYHEVEDDIMGLYMTEMATSLGSLISIKQAPAEAFDPRAQPVGQCG